MIVLGNDIGIFLLSALLAALISVSLLVLFLLNVRRQALASVAMIFIFLLASWLLHRFSDDIRSTGRWLLYSREYKAAVLSQPSAPNGEFRHIEWDGWGFTGAGDTTVYLVFDPQDALKKMKSTRSRSGYPGVPCDFWKSYRIEKGWYTVTFYTDTVWEYCGDPSPSPAAP